MCKVALDDRRSTIDLVAEGFNRLRHEHDLVARLRPVALFNGFADRRKRLDAISGVEPRRIDLVLEPRSFRKAAVARQCPFTPEQDLV